MKRRLFGAVALMCLLAIFAAPVAEGDPARYGPMQFSLQREGPAEACGSKCRTWVSATGMIRPDTARDFEAFAAKNNLRGATVVLNSEGGSVLGALALGRSIRRYEMTTMVGRTLETPGKNIVTLSPRADCESMCGFVMLGGVKRIVPTEARVRVHQIWLGDRRDDATAAVYSAEDLVLVQRDIGKLAQYTIEMGGTVEFLEMSLRIPPWEPMRTLTRDELRRTKLDTVDTADTRIPPPAGTTTSAAPPASVKRIALTNDRGWSMVERAGLVAMARKHPITFEGEQFGTLDMMFGCGETPNDYTVHYSETRPGRDGIAPVRPHKDVELRIGNRSIVLSPASSRVKPQEDGRTYAATGTVPATLLRHFAGTGSRSVTIETLSADNQIASIRIGNTGAGEHLTQLAAACNGQARIEHAGLVPPAQPQAQVQANTAE